MESDELYIHKRFGKRTPFVVPDGYFEVLCNRLEEHTIEKNLYTGFWRRYKLVAVAVSLLFIVSSTIAYLSLASDDNTSTHQMALGDNNSSRVLQSQQYAADEYADCAMLDNDDIYTLIASN